MREKRAGRQNSAKPLAGKTLAMIFENRRPAPASVRGPMTHLGGHFVVLRPTTCS